ncbi:putative endopeptidase [Lachnospiraceae bacterium KH1T2]|nr:putative endopeptidase [Lachnospiraceae bacterium KH1T2]
MKKRIVSIVLSVALISGSLLNGCGTNPSTDQTSSEVKDQNASETVQSTEAAASSESTDEADQADSESQVTTGGTPWIDSEIKENVSADTVTDQKDDFHLYANKDWILSNEIPDGHSTWSHYSECAKITRDKCIGLLKDESIEGHDADLVRTYNKDLQDWDAREKAGVSDIQELYEKIKAVKDTKELDALMTEADFMQEGIGLVSYVADLGLNDPSHYLVSVGSPSLLLNDSAEYSNRTEYGDMYFGLNKDMFVLGAGKLGMSEEDAEKAYESAIDFETKLAGSIYTTEESNSDDYMQKINNEMSFDELTSLCKAYPLGEILKADKYDYDGKYLVTEPEYLKKLDSLYTDENVDSIKNYFLVHYVLDYIMNLDKETYDKCIEINNKYLGTTGRVSDDEMAYSVISRAIPTSMQKVYIEKYGSEEDRQKMKDLCQDVKDTYREILTENSWISDESRKAALEKLDKLEIHAAYPDKFRDTSTLDISGCSLIEANRRIAKFNFDFNRSLIGKAQDKDMWAESMDILSCNAFYNPQDNTINMIIGMMDEPFYSDDMSTEELYASIGAFWAGHEISHAFDNNGAQFDADGNLKDWWTEADKAEFKKRTKKVDDYLDTIVAFDGKHMKGSNIDTELIADMTGLECALKMAAKVENFDYDKFFTKYAEMNCSLGVYSSELSQLSQDEHPLNYVRTNVPVQQFEEFYKTYDVKQGDNMYLAPEDRLVIW